MDVITSAKVKLTKQDIQDAIDVKCKEKGIERTGNIDFKTKLQKNPDKTVYGAVLTGAEFDAVIKPKK